MTTLTKFVDGVELPCTAEDIAHLEQISRDFIAFKAEEAKTQYQRDRAGEYPPITDYIDGVVKGDHAQIAAYVAACKAVKDKYPKP
jgi:hypothetical protein